MLKVVSATAAITTAVAFEPKGMRTEEFMMPTRDGIGLHTVAFYPKDIDEGKTYTTIVDRSPYGYGDMEWITDIFVPMGFVAMGQDMRGTEKSQGNFTMWQADKFDSEDMGNYIAMQQWSNGEVFSLGASADGIGSLQMKVNNPSWLKAQYMMWCPDSMYEILFPHGTYKQETAEDWLFGLSMPTPEVVYDNIHTIYENEAHTDYWRGIEESAEKYSHIDYPTAFAAGWYDVFLAGNLNVFDGYNTQCDESVRGQSKITIDPLGHCVDGVGFFTENMVNGQGRTALVLAQMLEVYGIRPVTRTDIKNITFYVMSSNDEKGKEVGQYWTSVDTWPKYAPTPYYLQASGTATTTAPTATDADDSTSYTVDPSDPILTLGGNNLPPGIGGSIHCGPVDQSSVDSRADVLTFDTPVMESALYMTGPMFAHLFVSSDAVDTDFMVKVSDLYPTGEAILIMDNAFRMRWREGGLEPVAVVKGEVYEITMNLWNTSWVVAPGHALRFSVQSSNNPRFSVNPQNGLLLKDAAYPGENVTAVNTIYHSEQYPSRITLPQVQKHQLPNVHVLKSVQEAYPTLTENMIEKFGIGLDNHLKTRSLSKK